MSQNQGKKITGYRDLSPVEVDMMNKVKEFERTLAALTENVRATLTMGTQVFPSAIEHSESMRQIALAKTHFEEGFMRLNRSIARPASPWTKLDVGNDSR